MVCIAATGLIGCGKQMKRQRNTKQFCFDFDIRFPKMPSYLRRSAVQHALGTVSSYKTRLDLWEKTDGKSGKPKLVYENHAMPVFYRDVMYREGAGRERRSIPDVPHTGTDPQIPEGNMALRRHREDGHIRNV